MEGPDINLPQGAEAISKQWADHFSSILNCINDEESKTKASALLASPNPIDVLYRVSTEDVRVTIKHLVNNKSAGCDGLPAECYKYSHPILHELLAALSNACLSHRFLPEALMRVHIIPLIKNKLKNPSDPGNYRPIAITTIASKILEHLLLNRLQPYLYTTNNQFGFKANQSTDACIYLLKEMINYYNTAGSPIYLCFVDVSKAFDRVNYHKLLIKLHERGTPLYLIGILSYWFSSQQFCINWDNSLSRCFGSSNGLRQGGILSPHLFNVYTDSLNVELNSLPIGCTINEITINNLCYADDMVLISPSAKGLQRLINTCLAFAEANDIIYNETKTQCMSILPNNFRNIPSPSMFLGHHRLQFVSEFPYLGHILTNDLKDTKDIANRRRKLCAVGNTITRQYGFCNLETKLTIFRAYCYSIYGCSLWTSYSQESLRALRVVHNDTLRRFTRTSRRNSAIAMFNTYGVNCLDVLIYQSTLNLRSRLLSNTNPLISNIIQSTAYVYSHFWTAS